jgi:catechol 2,3-dioxygenase-like lactoylglutathione lyase family enzyme
MIDHTGIGVADVAKAAAFYDAVLGALGMRRASQIPDGKGTDGIGYGDKYPVFWIDRFHPHDAKQHTAFAAKSRAEVDAFYTAGMKNGGKDNGKPGLRSKGGYPPGYYAAFLIDPDGNNMEAVCREGA